MIEIVYSSFSSTHIYFGLKIMSPQLPVVVGCSFQALTGKIIDIPIRYLKENGECLWIMEYMKGENLDDFMVTEHELGGFVRFSLWSDETFSERLADTDWKMWSIEDPHLLGTELSVEIRFPNHNVCWQEPYNSLRKF